jgi:hypothetical protein
MKKILSAIGVIATLVASTPVALAAGEGDHPWDARSLRTRTRINVYPYLSDFDIYSSPWRSDTHALHPYNRERYYDQFVYDYRLRTGRTLVRTAVYDEESTTPNCQNYTLRRPNYRVPPFGYRCQ